MCPPLVIAAVALGAAQAGMSIHSQRQQAKTQEKVQKNASRAEQQRHLAELSASRIRERQEMTAAAQRIQATTKAGREARATGRVSAGEAGVSGISVDALLNDITRQEAESRFSIHQQEEFNETNRALGLKDSGMQSRMNLLAINKPIAQPNYLGAVLDGASTSMDVYSFGKSAGFGEGGTKTTTTASGYGAGTTDLYKTPNFNQSYS